MSIPNPQNSPRLCFHPPPPPLPPLHPRTCPPSPPLSRTPPLPFVSAFPIHRPRPLTLTLTPHAHPNTRLNEQSSDASPSPIASTLRSNAAQRSSSALTRRPGLLPEDNDEDGGLIPSADDAPRLRLRSWSNPAPLPQTLQPPPPPPAPPFAHPRLGPHPIPTYPAAPAFVLALALDPWSLLLPRIRYARAAAAA